MERVKTWVMGLTSSRGDAEGRLDSHTGHEKGADSSVAANRTAAMQAKEQEATSGPLPKPDGGYGWLIVFGSFVVHVIIYGLIWSVGVFNVIFLDEFQQSKTSTAWVGSLVNALMFFSGPLSSALVKRYGCRPVLICGGLVASVGIALSSLAHQLWVLYLTFSLLGGVGLGISYMPTIVIVSEYFDQRRTIALGLAVSGVGFGSFIFPPLIRSLVSLYNWRMMMVIIGGIMLGSMTLFGALMKPAKKRTNHVTQKRNTEERYRNWLATNLEILKSVPYLTLCANNFLYCFGLVIVYVHLGSLSISSGLFSHANHEMLFSIIGASNLVGRILHGVVCHFPRMTTILVYMVSSIGSGIATLLMPVSAGVTTLAVCAAVFGFCSSCLGALLPDIIIRLVGEERLGLGYGLLLVFEGAGSMVGGPAAGMLFDYTQVYDYSFYMSGALLIGAGVVMVVPWQFTRSCRTTADRPEPDGQLAKAAEAEGVATTAETSQDGTVCVVPNRQLPDQLELMQDGSVQV